MKRLLLPIAACALLLASCTDAPDAEKADATDAKQVEQAAATDASYTVDAAQSTVEWVGTKPTGRHHGTFKIKEGNLMVANGNITGGKFIIDVASIKADDQDAEGNKKLEGHLASADFFDVQKFPNGTFEITSVTPASGTANVGDTSKIVATHTITGNLTLKDVTKSISFPAAVTMTDNQVNADANFNIDRTQWNMNYGSDKSLGDKFIRPEVNLKIHLVATK
ncbi:MAG: YceI family protein [Sphingobacteriales bacterium]|nr:MAG: YceI family protein [Sphingobacteriales bacterium]